MIKLIMIYPQPDDPEHFKDYYRRVHMPLCRRIPYVEHLAFAFEPERRGPGPDCFCLFEMVCRDEVALSCALASAEAKIAIADVENYSPDPPFSYLFSPET